MGLHRDENVTVSETEDGKLLINGNKITVFAEKEPKLIPWGSAGNSIELSASSQNIPQNLHQNPIKITPSQNMTKMRWHLFFYKRPQSFITIASTLLTYHERIS